MESKPVPEKERSFSPLGFLLVILGAGLLLSRLNVVPFRWSEVFWMGAGVFGLVLIIRAIVLRRRKGVLFGSFLMFFSTALLLRRWDVLDPFPPHWFADIMLIIAASYFVLYLFDVRRMGLLIPVFVFGGMGALYYLWWLGTIELYEVRMYIKTYWPVILILFGLGVILKRRSRK